MPGQVLHQLIYSSRALVAPNSVRESIMADCLRNNRRDGITGMLVCDGSRFLQALEGGESLVRRCFERIEADGRHDRVELIRTMPIPVRQFGNWSMSYKQVNSPVASRDYLERLKLDLREITDGSMLALFFGFAALSSVR